MVASYFSRGMQAVVAAAAVFLRPDLAEVAQQTDAAAGVAFGEVRHLVELVAGDVARLLVGDFVEELEVFHHVAAGEEQQAFGGQAVAAGAAGFLIVALDVLRQVVVDDEADVRFVDAHAEGDGGADDSRLVAQEGVLVFRALRRRRARRDRRRRKIPASRSVAASASVPLRDWQ